jgi:polysaccharide biosynthesis transport protein
MVSKNRSAPQPNPKSEVRLLNRLRPIGRRKFVFIGVIILCSLASFGISRLQSRTYSATALLLFRDTTTTPAFLGTSQSLPLDPTQEAATDLQITSLPRISRLVAAQFRLSEPFVAAETTVAPEGQSNVIGITVTDPSPKRAAGLATAYAAAAISVRRQADQASLFQTLKLVQTSFNQLGPRKRSTAYGRQLQSEASQLSVLASLQTGQAELIQAAQIPTSPSSLGAKVYVVFGFLIGLGLAYGLVTLLDLLDRRIHTVEDLTEAVAVPIMGFVPSGLRPEADRDAFNMIRTNLRYVPDRPVQSVLVTSTQPEEGKTTVAWNLATVAAEAGTATLLIEADLRRPSLVAFHGVAADTGLSDVLAGLTRWQDSVISCEFAGSDRTVDVLPAGPHPSNPTDLLASTAMITLLREVVEEYALIVIDSSPLGLVPDAVPVAAITDATLIIARLKRTRHDQLADLVNRLDDISVRVLGIVANYCERSGGYGYGYGYGYDQPRHDVDAPRSSVGLEGAARTLLEDGHL